jgi:glycosyltransferase involved in cell wall biosynthesis
MVDPRVSVIIPVFNSSKYIEETLTCVQKSEYKSYECIIIDDHSKDNSIEIIERFIKDKLNFHLFVNPDKGVSSARNLGILKSKGKYILPLDSDDLISISYIRESADILDNNPDIGLVYCDAEKFGDEEGPWLLPEFDNKQIYLSNMIFVTSMYRRSDYDKTRGYNENMNYGLEDWDFILHLIELGVNVYKIPKVHFYYRIRKNSRQQNINCEEQKENEMYLTIWKNHRAKYVEYFGIPQKIFIEHNRLINLINTIRNSKSYRIGNFIINLLNRISLNFKK